MTNTDALKVLYRYIGGDLADVINLNVSSDVIVKIAERLEGNIPTPASEGGHGNVLTNMGGWWGEAEQNYTPIMLYLNEFGNEVYIDEAKTERISQKDLWDMCNRENLVVIFGWNGNRAACTTRMNGAQYGYISATFMEADDIGNILRHFVISLDNSLTTQAVYSQKTYDLTSLLNA